MTPSPGGESCIRGAKLGWLLDQVGRNIQVYKSNEPIKVLENSERVSGEPVTPGFVLELKPIWESGF